MMQDTKDAPLTTLDAAKLADVSPETIRAWERLGRLPAVRTSSGQRIFTKPNVLKAVAERAERKAGRG
jgi:DNA-binding transcriptional MerR regulator